MSRSSFHVLSAVLLGIGLAACTSSASSEKGTTSTKATTTTTSSKTAATNDKAAPMKATIGMRAPDFTLKDIDGKSVKLSDLRGKTVVLEWFNPDCPYVQYAYTAGPLATMATECRKDGVVWLSINSGAPGKQGAGLQRSKTAHDDWNMSSTVLIDETGDVGRKYEAKTTPHMFVIDRNGTLVYEGALDNAPHGKLQTTTAVNYVEAALTDLRSGRPVAIPETDPYGCSVKYANP